jgi:hypothetical protein
VNVESNHWERSERLGHSAGCVYSLQICRAAIAAEQREARGPSWWRIYFERVWGWIKCQKK